MSKLPSEIWLKILQKLDRSDVRTMSLVSQNLHIQALSILFHYMVVWFGRFPFRQERNELVYQEDWVESKEEEITLRSLNILLRIAENTAFARAITHFRAIALVEHMMVFERYHLRVALNKMVNLRRFDWIGEAFRQDVAKELRPDMDSLYITQLDETAGVALSSITGLRELRLIDSNKSSFSIGSPVDPGVSVLNAIFEKNKRSLQHISLPGSCAWKSDLLRLSDNLTSLAVNNAGQCGGLDLFLRHANALESLTLLDLHTLDFFSRGTDDKDLLPNLKDLKLQMDYPVPGQAINLAKDSRSLLSFMDHHRQLECFDFSLWSANPDVQHRFLRSWDVRNYTAVNGRWFSNVIRAIKKLEGVRALGVSFPSLPPVEMEHLLGELCTERILHQCTALRISGVDKVSFHEIIDDVLSRLEGLTFLALHNARPFEQSERKRRLPEPEAFVRTYNLPSLQTVCLANRMFDLDRSGLRFVPYFRWSAVRVRLRTETDFPSTDAYWLMSYRSLSDQYDYAPTHSGEEEVFSDEDEFMNLGW